MSGTYSGKKGNISTAAGNNVQASTNATPIRLTLLTPVTSAIDGTRARVSGHQVNTAANGLWVVSFVDPTHVDLVGSVGTAVGGATGTFQSLSLGAFTLVDDSSVPNAAQFGVPSEFDADAAAFTSECAGKYKLVDIYQINVSVDSTGNAFAAWDDFATPLVHGTNAYVDLQFGTIWNLTASGLALPGTAPMAGDFVEVDVGVTALLSNGAGGDLPINFTLWMSDVAPGAADNYALMLGTGHPARVWGGSPTFPITPMHLKGVWPVATNSAVLKVKLRANTTQADISGAGALLNMVGDYQVIGKLYRPTGMPQ